MSIITVLAHEGVSEVVQAPLTELIKSNQISLTLASVAALFILTIMALVFNKLNQKNTLSSIESSIEPVSDGSQGALWKIFIFISMLLVIIGNTFYLASSTIYVNAKSITNGPVHWHADFEVWDCGKEIELVDPKPPLGEIGSPLLHEHNDKQMHVEGVVFDKKDISLSAFFRIVGGDLDSDYLKMPTNQEVVERRTGDLCPDGTQGSLQIFLYKAGSFNQQKMTDLENYLMTPEQKVPPGDCIIVEFGPLKEQTDKLCQSYQVAKEKKLGS